MRNPQVWRVTVLSQRPSDIGYTYMKRTLPSRGSQSSRNQECRWAEAAATIKLVVAAEWAFPEH